MALCFPTGCLKLFIGIGSVLTILIAIAMLAATIYANVQKDKIIDKGDINIANGALVGLYVASIIFLIMGFAGIYGSIKKNKFLLSLFAIGTFLFILVFIGGAFLFFLAPKTIFDGTCLQSKTSWINDLGVMNAQAESILCQAPCLCNFKNVNDIYSPEEVNNLTNFGESGVSKAQDCPAFSSKNFSSGNILLMSTLQVQLQCGGWCDNDYGIFHYYNDISVTTKPTDSCYNAFKGFFEKNGVILGVGCTVAMAFSLLNMIMICCLCFHPSKSGNRSDFYRRMVEDD